MSASPKEKRGLYGTALRTVGWQIIYHALTLFTTPLGRSFWFFEQKRGLLADRIENERSDR